MPPCGEADAKVRIILVLELVSSLGSPSFGAPRGAPGGPSPTTPWWPRPPSPLCSATDRPIARLPAPRCAGLPCPEKSLTFLIQLGKQPPFFSDSDISRNVVPKKKASSWRAQEPQSSHRESCKWITCDGEASHGDDGPHDGGKVEQGFRGDENDVVVVRPPPLARGRTTLLFSNGRHSLR